VSTNPHGPGPLTDDDLVFVRPWEFEPEQVAAPTLLLHGRCDRVVPCSHSEWLARQCPNTELRLTSGDGHLSILNHAENALAWLIALPR
jgi:pimeloyl-ACP methyl ester carboxylesterase